MSIRILNALPLFGIPRTSGNKRNTATMSKHADTCRLCIKRIARSRSDQAVPRDLPRLACGFKQLPTRDSSLEGLVWRLLGIMEADYATEIVMVGVKPERATSSAQSLPENKAQQQSSFSLPAAMHQSECSSLQQRVRPDSAWDTTRTRLSCSKESTTTVLMDFCTACEATSEAFARKTLWFRSPDSYIRREGKISHCIRMS